MIAGGVKEGFGGRWETWPVKNGSLGQVGKGKNLCSSLGKEIYKVLKVKERPLRAVSATAADCATVTNKPKPY